MCTYYVHAVICTMCLLSMCQRIIFINKQTLNIDSHEGSKGSNMIWKTLPIRYEVIFSLLLFWTRKEFIHTALSPITQTTHIKPLYGRNFKLVNRDRSPVAWRQLQHEMPMELYTNNAIKSPTEGKKKEIFKELKIYSMSLLLWI